MFNIHGNKTEWLIITEITSFLGDCSPQWGSGVDGEAN